MGALSALCVERISGCAPGDARRSRACREGVRRGRADARAHRCERDADGARDDELCDADHEQLRVTLRLHDAQEAAEHRRAGHHRHDRCGRDSDRRHVQPVSDEGADETRSQGSDAAGQRDSGTCEDCRAVAGPCDRRDHDRDDNCARACAVPDGNGDGDRPRPRSPSMEKGAERREDR